MTEKKYTIKQGWLSILIILLSGCTFLSPVKTDAYKTYELKTVPQVLTKKSAHPATLFVVPIETAAIYNTPQMAYTAAPYQVDYFAKNRWVESPAQMLQPLVIQTLQNTHYFRAVLSSPPGAYYDFVLRIQLVELRQEFLPSTGLLHLILRAEVVSVASKQVIATRQFAMTEAVPEQTPYGGVVAANKATADMLKKLAAFCLEKI